MHISPSVEVREILHPALQPVHRHSRDGPFSTSDDNSLGVRIDNSTGRAVIYTVTNGNPSDYGVVIFLALVNGQACFMHTSYHISEGILAPGSRQV